MSDHPTIAPNGPQGPQGVAGTPLPPQPSKSVSELDRLKLSVITEKLKRNEAQAQSLQLEHNLLREQRNTLIASLMAAYGLKLGDTINTETGEIIRGS